MNVMTPRLGILGLLLIGGSSGWSATGLLTTGEFSGHTYQIWGNDGVVDAQRNFADATAFAGTLAVGGAPGNLVRIDSFDENAFVFGLLSTVSGNWGGPVADGGNGRYAWIGAADQATEGDWRWQDGDDPFWSGGPAGSTVGGLFQNWAIGSSATQSEPDNFGGTQDGGAMALDQYPVGFGGFFLGSPGQWNDINTGNVLPFVVEFAAVPEPSDVAWATSAILGGWVLLRHVRRPTLRHWA